MLAYAVALIQRPGEVVAETKVDLYVDPSRFLESVLSVWSPTVDLGHVFGAQYSGYAWPFAPWMAAGDALGLPVWLTHRLWLGTLLAVAAVGAARLVARLAPDAARSPLAAGAAGLLYAINPYTTVYLDRTSITLLTYAALPWLVLAVERGLRDPRGWRWPIVFALVLTSTGGGVNVAVSAWVLLGPAAFAVYLLWLGDVSFRGFWSWLWRLSLVTFVLQLWWLVPVAIQASAGANFLPFTEQPGTIWSTTSLPESLRLMGFWTSYVGVGYGGDLVPFHSASTAMLHLLPVVIAGLWVGGASLLSFAALRRWRYAPFFFLLTIGGLAIMSAGWPDGTPLRRAITGVYYRVEVVDAFRTTYKAGALAALGLAVLGGLGVATLAGRAAGRVARAAIVSGGVVLVALSAWPLVTGRALEPQLAFDVPGEWRQAARDLDARRDDTRALHLPGSLFGYHDWGGTVDPILPVLTERPTVARWIVPYGDLRATDLQWAADGLVSQGRLRPGQLAPLLDLMSVGTVVVSTDGDRARSGEVPAGDVVRDVRRQRLGRVSGYGQDRDAPLAAGTPDAPVRAPRLIRIERDAPPILSALPQGRQTIVDGGAGGIAALAAFGDLEPRLPLRYAPDLKPAEVREAGAEGASIVTSDTNRRGAFVASRTLGARGPVLRAGESLSIDGTMLDPWGGYPGHQTVSELSGVRSLEAPASPQVTQFPERRPFAAVDGDPATAWLADRTLERDRHRLTMTFDRPRRVPAIRLLPYSDSRAVVRAVRVNGREHEVVRGWNRISVGGGPVSSIEVAISRTDRPEDAQAGAGGIRELQVPGVTVRERLRPPITATGALDEASARHADITYLLARNTADRPAIQNRYAGERGASLLRDAQDPEGRLSRVLDPPVRRPVAATAFASVAPDTPDDAIDALYAGRLEVEPGATSSSRFAGQPRFRASGAFDRGRRSWIGQWIAGRPAWIAWRTREPARVTRLVLRPADGLAVRRPTAIRISAGSQTTGTLAVSGAGVVKLPSVLTGTSFRVDIVRAAFPKGTPGRDRQRRAVGIGEISGGGTVATPRAPDGPAIGLPCGAAAVDIGRVTVRLGGSVSRAGIDDGRGVRLEQCGPGATIGPSRTNVDDARGPLRVDALRLRGSAPAPLARAATAGRVEPGRITADGGRKGAAVTITEPGWISFGQSFNPRWRAICDGADLGEPEPFQGYANGWRLARSCERLDIEFGPQAAVRAGYLVSIAGLLVALALLAAGTLRARQQAASRPPADPLPAPRTPATLRARTAVLHALLPAAIIGGCFGLRAGAVALPVLTLIGWRAISDRLLVRASAAILLLAVPVTYLIVALIEGSNPGGNNTQYATDRLAAHWMTLAALILLVVVATRSLSTARDRGGDAPGSAS